MVTLVLSQDDSWTPIANMMVPRCEFGLAAVDGCLYAFGGWVRTDITIRDLTEEKAGLPF